MELRCDPCTGEWVIVVPERGRRPGAFPRHTPAAPAPDFDPDCPFCPGNEHRTPATLAVWPPTGPWQVRAVGNLYPMVGPDPGPQAAAGGGPLFSGRPGRGAHEVIVESPVHNRHLADLTPAAAVGLVRAYRDRYRSLHDGPGSRYVQLFRNHGTIAGSSQVHPHAQVVALPVVPGAVRRRRAIAARHHRRTGRCLYCDLVAAEEQHGDRWVAGSPELAAFCPYASRFPYEVWIMPRRHGADFGRLGDDDLPAVARALQDVLRRLGRRLGDPAFNLMLQSWRAGPADRPDFHWHLVVAPRLSHLAGFEMGTGMSVVTRAPEEAAADLRGAGAGPG